MTERQRITLMSHWWPAAAETCGWDRHDRALRLRVLGFAISLPRASRPQLLSAIQSDAEPMRAMTSANDLNQKSDIDAVKSALGLLADKLSDALDTPERGQARRLIFQIGQAGEEAYTAAIARDKFGTDDLERLKIPELKQLLFTLIARARSRRHKQPANAIQAEKIDSEMVPF